MGMGMLILVLIFSFPLVLVAGLFTVWAMKIAKGGRTEEIQADETRMIQEIHQGLSRMEQRIEALETILLTPGPDRKEGVS